MSLPRLALLSSVVLALAGWALATGGGHRDDSPAAKEEVRSSFFSLAGQRLHTLEAGPSSEHAVLLLHGARFQAETWRKLGTLDLLAGSGRRVIALDLPGFGESPRGAAKLDWPGALAALGLRKVVVLSPSMSGSYAFPLLLDHPDLLAGFVAVAPVGIDSVRDLATPSAVPALLLWGEDDKVVPVASADALAAAFTGARRVVFPGAGHPCYLDAPEAFHRELLGFLDQVLPSSSAPVLPEDQLEDDLAERELPRGFPSPLPAPEGNEHSTLRFELGRTLFFDPILSDDRSVSCASCHQPEYGFASPEALPLGVHGQRCKRNAPTLFNRAFASAQMWDGRVEGLEAQVLMPIEAPNEMGLPLEGAVARLREDPDYPARFQKAYGQDPDRKTLSYALASFVRRLWLGDSPVDRFRAADVTHLDREARQGLWIFESRGGCWKCHNGPNFSDESFHNTGIGVRDGLAEDARGAITGKDADRGKFRTPTLRGLSRTAPYMHDGSIATLEEVVKFYRRGGNANPHHDSKMQSLNLTDEDAKNLVAFLRALSETVEPE